jgi:dedicated sortase system histidine kinase
MSFPKPRLGLRIKLVFLSSFLFAIPWLGYKYVWEMEKYLRKGQEQTLVGTVSAAATALHERPNLFNAQASFLSDMRQGRDLYAIDVSEPIQLDGNLEEWKSYQYQPHYYGDDYVIENKENYDPKSLSFNHMVVKYENYLYVMFEVIDDYIVYRKNENFNIHRNDTIQIAFLNKEGQFNRYIISNDNPGWVNAYLTKPEEGSVYPVQHESKIQGNWVETPKGYNVELRIPLEMIGNKLGFAIYDVDNSHSRKIKNVVGTSNTQNPEQLGTVLVPSPEIEQILKGLARSNSRIWVIDSHRRVLARIGDIRSASGVILDEEAKNHSPNRSPLSWLQRLEQKYLHPVYYQLLTRPPQDFVDELEEATELLGSQVDDAISGEVGSSWYLTPDKRAVVLSAAHPIWVDEKVMGVVVAEETTNGIRTIRNKALERLFSVILAVMLLSTLALFLFASRISYRIRKLRSQAEHAIDEQGRIHTTFKGSNVNDEIGDLSRSFSSIVNRLGQYNSYLENMTSRLSHEFRTPVTVVRSSLDNLAMLDNDDDAKVYMERAQEGIKRLNTILTNMSEATGLDHSLQSSEKEIFNLTELVEGCIAGYRGAYKSNIFEAKVDADVLQINGVPENIAQLIDKVIANAVEFSLPKDSINITLSKQMGQAKLVIMNKGPLLSEEMQGRLFESMVSVRNQNQKNKTGNSESHLGIGLYIARVIAEFHQGHITIENNPQQSGVMATIWLPIITQNKFE